MDVAELANERIAENPGRAEAAARHAEQGEHAAAVARGHDEVLRLDDVGCASDGQAERCVGLAVNDVDAILLVELKGRGHTGYERRKVVAPVFLVISQNTVIECPCLASCSISPEASYAAHDIEN